jgi:hypothetical protein
LQWAIRASYLSCCRSDMAALPLYCGPEPGEGDVFVQPLREAREGVYSVLLVLQDLYALSRGSGLAPSLSTRFCAWIIAGRGLVQMKATSRCVPSDHAAVVRRSLVPGQRPPASVARRTH